jgi:ABC-type lipoprotein export system ATPase subunit
VIDVADLFQIYRGPERDVAALRGLTLHVEDGERVLVHGPSGSGKSTLMRVLAGAERPTAGRAVVRERDLANLDRAGLHEHARRSLGLVDQLGGRNLRPELTCLDNVALQLGLLGLARDERRRRARALLDELGLGAFAARRPMELSGGEAQRVALCAALAHDPSLILADEPTGELDATSAGQVYDLLQALAERGGATLLVVSHDPGASRIAHRVVRIRDGRLSEERSPADARDEALVVDDRGWLRLPDTLRRQAGIDGRAFAIAADGGVVLRGARTPAAGPPAAAAEPPAPSSPPATAVVARLAGVRRRFGQRVVLDGLDLELRAGALVALRGRSGSGKSTALRLLAGLDRPDEGDVVVAGTSLVGLDRRRLALHRRTAVATVLQRVALADALDVRENVVLACAIRRGAPLAETRLEALVDALGLGALRGRPARLLSGGERQRVAVARALASSAPLVLLDEPTSQLDEQNAGRLGDLLRAEAEHGRAILAATHDPALVARAHVVVEIGHLPGGSDLKPADR